MKIKWGVIGCGGIADRRTIPGLMLAENAELVAVMDANGEAAARVKEKYGARYAFDKMEDLLALDEIAKTCPVCEEVFYKRFTHLPIYGLTDDQLKYMADAVLEAVAEMQAGK